MQAVTTPAWGQQTVLKCPKCNCSEGVTFLPSRSRPKDKKCACGDCGYRWRFVNNDPEEAEEAEERATSSKPLTSTTLEDVLSYMRATQEKKQ